MGRNCVKLGVVSALMFVIVYTTWHICLPRYTHDKTIAELDSTHDRERVSIGHWDQRKTSHDLLHSNNVSGRKVTANRTITGDKTIANDKTSTSNSGDRSPASKGDDTVVGNDVEGDVEDGGTHDSRPGERIRTFFTSLQVSFDDVKIGVDNSIPTLPFLEACMSTTQLFVSMKKMILNRVVDDIRGNVEKIRLNYDSLPEESSTLQEMVLRDRDQGLFEEGSTFLALTWLKRAFEFISKFLTYIDQGMEQSDSARLAYEETLRQHHNFIVKGMFKAAFMTLSSRSAFLNELAINPDDVERPDFEEIAMEDLRNYNRALSDRLAVLKQFFDDNEFEN